MRNFEGVRFFKPWEFNAPERMDHGFLLKLDQARALAQTPFTVSHVRQFRPGDHGDHGDGTGVDIRCHFSRERFYILCGVLGIDPYDPPANTFDRIGIYDKHIHVGMSTVRPSKVAWVGRSQ